MCIRLPGYLLPGPPVHYPGRLGIIPSLDRVLTGCLQAELLVDTVGAILRIAYLEGTLLFLVSLRENTRFWGPSPARAGPEIFGIDSRGSSSTISTTRAPTRLGRGRKSRGVARVAGSCQGSALRARLGLVIEVFLSIKSLLFSSEIVL